MKTVTKGEFFKVICPLDVTPYPVGNFPYTTHWKLRNGQLVGVSKAISVNESEYQLVTQGEEQ